MAYNLLVTHSSRSLSVIKPRLIDAPHDVVEEQAIAIDIRGVDIAFGIPMKAAKAFRIHADDLMIASMLHQQTVRPARDDAIVVTVRAVHLVQVPVEVAQVIRPWHQLRLALEYGRPVDIMLAVLEARFAHTLLQVNIARDIQTLLRAHYQKDNGLRWQRDYYLYF